MVVVSLKDYAAEKGISYEAVRQQVVRYKEALEGHIIRDGRQQFLDEEAVAFLDAKRQKSPVVIIQQGKDEQIAQLTKERDLLLKKVAAQADHISELSQWKAEHALAIAEADQTKLLLDGARAELALVRDAKSAQELAFAQELEDAKEQARSAAQQEQEAELRQARSDVASLSELAQGARQEADELHLALEQEKAARAAAESREAALKNRSWWERLIRKGE